MARALLLVILLGGFQAAFSLPKKKIFIGALVPSYNKDFYGFQTALEYATETVNNRSDILKDYELVVRYADTKVRKTCRKLCNCKCTALLHYFWPF